PLPANSNIITSRKMRNLFLFIECPPCTDQKESKKGKKGTLPRAAGKLPYSQSNYKQFKRGCQFNAATFCITVCSTSSMVKSSVGRYKSQWARAWASRCHCWSRRSCPQ